MAAEEITSILQEVIENDLLYCAICLRTDRQRTLHESKTFLLCARKLRLRPPVNKLLCYVCEAQVSRAWRALHAVGFAASVDGWFYSASRLEAADMKKDLERTTRLLSFNEQPLDEFWRQLRARTHLALTDPLLVSSNDPQMQEAPAPESPGLLSRNPVIENVVIIDEDDPQESHLSPPLEIVPLEKLIENPQMNYSSLTADRQQIMTMDRNSPNCYVLYPIVTGIDKNLYVPCLNARIVNNSVEFVDEKVVEMNLGQDFRNNLKKNNGDTMKVDAFEKTAPKFLQEKKGGTSKHAIMNDKVDWEAKIPMDVISFVEKERETPKHAIMKDRVDWEAKIPMDVISFVDATDPNAEQFILSETASKPSTHQLASQDPSVQLALRPLPRVEQTLRVPPDRASPPDNSRPQTPFKRSRPSKKCRLNDFVDNEVIIDLC